MATLVKTRKLVVNFFAAVALCLIIGTEINSIAYMRKLAVNVKYALGSLG